MDVSLSRRASVGESAKSERGIRGERAYFVGSARARACVACGVCVLRAWCGALLIRNPFLVGVCNSFRAPGIPHHAPTRPTRLALRPRPNPSHTPGSTVAHALSRFPSAPNPLLRATGFPGDRPSFPRAPSAPSQRVLVAQQRAFAGAEGASPTWHRGSSGSSWSSIDPRRTRTPSNRAKTSGTDEPAVGAETDCGRGKTQGAARREEHSARASENAGEGSTQRGAVEAGTHARQRVGSGSRDARGGFGRAARRARRAHSGTAMGTEGLGDGVACTRGQRGEIVRLDGGPAEGWTEEL